VPGLLATRFIWPDLAAPGIAQIAAMSFAYPVGVSKLSLRFPARIAAPIQS